ncbi:MAG: SprT family zinc-dependent metalloprotease [Sphingomonadales bacterium]
MSPSSPALLIRRNPRARRIRLSIDRVSGAAVLTLPPGACPKAGLAFAESHHDWITAQQARLPRAVPFAPGAIIPLHGRDVRLDHAPGVPGIHRDEDTGTLVVGGPLENFARRFERWIRDHARTHLESRAGHFARLAGHSFTRLRLSDTRSRWGSCSSTGTLSLSWRLVCAPEFVSDYVTAHEVAHLAELNHGPRFWAVVQTLVGDPGPARHWLRNHGEILHRLGRVTT